jgi:hypothetical protein
MFLCLHLSASLHLGVIMSSIKLPAGMHEAYRETHFRLAEHADEWPREFAIITAYATTGEKWSDAENEAADRALHAELRQHSQLVRRITGYSPSTGHAEPGWAVALPFDIACEIGLRYRQDAIYFVSRDVLSVSFLSVSYCDARRSMKEIGPFSPRVHATAR